MRGQITKQHDNDYTDYLAFDLGAESGRGCWDFDGEQLTLRELGRFPTTPGEPDLGHADGVRRWDIVRASSDEMRGILGRRSGTRRFARGNGVDTWGVDYGLFDDQGDLLDAPVQYRDDLPARAARPLS